MTSEQIIIRKLDTILADLGDMIRHISDVDIVLTEDDLVALKEADADFRNGKTKRLG